MRILVTGGAGYIGSHSCLELLNSGHQVVVVDNLSNSKEESLRRVERITGKSIEFHKVDLLDFKSLDKVFSKNGFDAVIHFAGLKAVNESVQMPLLYYWNNIIGTLNLCAVMNRHKVKSIVFSSSATVYGDPKTVPITEDFPVQTTNPYGRTKLMIEEILRDMRLADHEWNVILLRYFNPVGAHESGEIGEDPSDIPNNLFPFITQVGIGKLEKLSVFGGDYPTIDGTGVRDYIHVVDLAEGHVKALEKLETKPGVAVYNLGTGTGYSVLQVIEAFEKAAGVTIPYEIVERRSGDVAVCYADPSLANRELGWQVKRDLQQMCADGWRWQTKNPNGFE